MAHLSDDKTVAKMGHPNLDVGHPARRMLWHMFRPPSFFYHACVGLSDDETVAKMGRLDLDVGHLHLQSASSFGLHSGPFDVA